jgi:hypothetical protein
MANSSRKYQNAIADCAVKLDLDVFCTARTRLGMLKHCENIYYMSQNPTETQQIALLETIWLAAYLPQNSSLRHPLSNH